MNRKYKRKDKRPIGIPTGIQRLDKELMSEVRLFVSLGNTVEQASKVYHISEQMVKYSCRMGKDFDKLQKDLEEGE